MTPEINILVQALGYAILHSVWQCLLLYILLVITFKVLPKSFSALKYNLGLMTFVVVFAWFVDTLLRYWHHLKGVKITIAEQNGREEILRTVNTTLRTGAIGLDRIDAILPRLESIFPFIVLLYISGVIFLLLRLTVNVLNISVLRRNNVKEPPAYWVSKFYEWKNRLNISKKILFLLSDIVDVPVMLGVIKPVILIPASAVTQLSSEQLEAILVHEIMHVKRYDYLVNIVQSVIETFLFYNPFAMLISGLIRKEREFCCDDAVLKYTSDPMPYAKALASLEFLRHNTVAMAATGNKKQLFNRIKRIMEMKKNTTRNGIVPAILLLVTISLLLTFLAPAIAQSAKEKKTAKEKTTSKTEIVIIDDNGTKRTYHSLNEMPPGERKELEEKLEGVNIEVKKTVAEAKDEMAAAMEEAKEAIKSVDIQTNVSKAMEEIDWESIHKEIKTAMKESKVAMNEASKAVTAINMDSLNNVVTLALNTSKAAIAAINFDSINNIVAIALDSAHDAIKKANIVVTKANGNKVHTPTVKTGYSFDKVISKMENEGLIDKEYSYKIEKKHNQLYINGVLQPERVQEKYLKYFKGERVTIKGDGDDINIKIRN